MTDSEFRSLREKWEYRHEESQPMTVGQKCAALIGLIVVAMVVVWLWLP